MTKEEKVALIERIQVYAKEHKHLGELLGEKRFLHAANKILDTRITFNEILALIDKA